MEVRLFPPSEEELILDILTKFKLPYSLLNDMRKYLSGELSENRLICCHTDCNPCEDTVYQAVKECKMKMGIE
jgi:hypothetical protein